MQWQLQQRAHVPRWGGSCCYSAEGCLALGPSGYKSHGAQVALAQAVLSVVSPVFQFSIGTMLAQPPGQLPESPCRAAGWCVAVSRTAKC